MKNNAIDYLIELAENDKCNAWISYVIKYFIENQGVIDDNAKNDLADYLLQRKGIPELKSPSYEFNSNNEKIILKKLKFDSLIIFKIFPVSLPAIAHILFKVTVPPLFPIKYEPIPENIPYPISIKEIALGITYASIENLIIILNKDIHKFSNTFFTT